jgi:RNA polymerase sigma-70 factor (ECF subfamily)
MGGSVDPDLVVRAQRGDHASFERLALALSDRVHGVAFNILRDREQAEDATQQTLMAVWRDLPQLRDPARFEAWVYRIAVRACHAEARRSRRWLSVVSPLAGDGPTVTDAALEAVVDRDRFDRAFHRLSVDQRTVIVLHHYLGLTIEQVAETVGISDGTVKSRLNRGCARLRTALAVDATDTAETTRMGVAR